MFVIPTETEKELYADAKSFVLQRREELVNTINQQKEFLKTLEIQHALAKLIIEKAETDGEFIFAVPRQKLLLKELDDKKLIEKSLENIDYGEQRLEEIDKVIEKYFTEQEYSENDVVNFKYNKVAIACGEIFEVLK